MKKIFAFAFAAVSLIACNDGTDNNDVTVTETDEVQTETHMESTGSYTASEGDVKYTDDKVMVMRNGDWVEADNDVTLDDGVVVYRNGRVTRNDKEVRLRDGEVVTKTGRFFDNTGHAIENAWDATKEGAKDAGRAVKDAANKAGNKIDDAFDGDKNDNKH